MRSSWRWILVLILAAVLVGYFAYSRRFIIEAKLWHWKHGNRVLVGPYEQPAPNEWLVTDEKPDSVLLINTVKPIHSGTDGFQINATILASSLRPARVNLDFWFANKQQRLTNEKVGSIEKRTIQLANEQVGCIGGTELRDVVGIANATTISLECRSSGTLSLIFTGQPSDLEAFYSLVSRIRRGS